MYSIEDLSLFIKVVNLGNFSNTASLFLRDGRTFELTKTGQQIYSLLSSELQQFEQLSHKVETNLNRSSTPCGKLRKVTKNKRSFPSNESVFKCTKRLTLPYSI
jgi:hypothetical protein